MLNKKLFTELRNQMKEFDQMREEVIIISRSILKDSKAAIYACHRGDLKGAQELLDSAKKSLGKLNTLFKKDAYLATTGAYLDAIEEYTEAALYIHYLVHKDIPTPKDLNVDADIYLGGLSDFTGELVRKAVNSVVAGDFETALTIKDLVTEIYNEMLLFDWRNTPVRKKFDSIKYNLEKLEDVALKIKFKHN